MPWGVAKKENKCILFVFAIIQNTTDYFHYTLNKPYTCFFLYTLFICRNGEFFFHFGEMLTMKKAANYHQK